MWIARSLRTLVTQRQFTVSVVLTLALGVAGITSSVAIVNAVLLRPLPYPEPHRLVAVSHTALGISKSQTGVSSGLFHHYSRRAFSFENLAVYDQTGASLQSFGGPPVAVSVTLAHPDLFTVLRVRPYLGRLFRPEDGTGGFERMTWAVPIVISYEFWRDHFGADRDVLGRAVTLDKFDRIILGVMPLGFEFPSSSTQVWMMFIPPLSTARLVSPTDPDGLDAIGRLRKGVTAKESADELTRLIPSIEGQFQDATAERIGEVDMRPVVMDLKESMVGGSKGVLRLLLAAGVVLVLASFINLSSLIVSRTEHRQHEIGVRTALGAGRMDVLRLLAAEATVLTILGVAGGIAAAWVGLAVVGRYAVGQLPRFEVVRIDVAALGAAAVAGFLSLAILTGVPFAAAMLRAGALRSLRETSQRSSSSPKWTLVRHLAMALQMGFAVVLCFAAALMAHTSWKLANVDPGFRPVERIAADVTISGALRRSPALSVTTMLDRTRSIPGVTATAAVSELPFDERPDTHLYPLSSNEHRSDTRPVSVVFVSRNYFDVMGIPVAAGASGRSIGSGVTDVVLSASLSRRLFGQATPLGRTVTRLEADGSPVRLFDRKTRTFQAALPYTVAGLAADVLDGSPRVSPSEIVYVPLRETMAETALVPTHFSIVARTRPSLSGVSGAIRRVLSESSADVTVGQVVEMKELVNRAMATELLLATVLSIAATAALLLGGVGVYAVTAEAVAHRRHEVAIRMALGATSRSIYALITRRALGWLFVGIGIGSIGAAWSGRLLASVVFGVSASDPFTRLAVPVSVALIGLLAMTGAALRAARANVPIALRPGE